jgi:hypothetical protein
VASSTFRLDADELGRPALEHDLPLPQQSDAGRKSTKEPLEWRSCPDWLLQVAIPPAKDTLAGTLIGREDHCFRQAELSA